MYALKPTKVYAADCVRANPAWVARMNRILDAIGHPRSDVTLITERNLPEVVAELGHPVASDAPAAGPGATFTRPLLFMEMDLREQRPDLAGLVERCGGGKAERIVADIHGQLSLVRPTHPREDDQRKNLVCWPTHDFGAMHGCPHGCFYCGEGHWGGYIAVSLNCEEYVEQIVGPTIEKQAWQKCFRMIGWGADLIAFEPEYGMFDLFTRKLAEYDDRYGLFHTAGTNVDWIADLPHRDRLIGVWTVTCEGVARLIEPGAPPAVERFEAGRRCRQMGLPIRYKFKPIVPIRGWREDYAAAIGEALSRSQPESIGLCVLMWMDFEALSKFIDLDLLDPELVAAAREAADEMKGVRTGPFPHAVRAEIYRFFIEQVRRHDKTVPLYISTETREMWDELTDALGQDPRRYVCGCGSLAVPGRRLSASDECRFSTYSPTPA